MPLLALMAVATCGLAPSSGARADRTAAAVRVSTCPAEVMDAPGWQLVETPVVRFCVPPGWAAVAARPEALIRLQGAKGWVEWRVGPFPRALPPPLPELDYGRSDLLPRAGRPAETAIASDDHISLGSTYWYPTDDAPGLVLLSKSAGDTLHPMVLRTVRLEGAHRLPPDAYFPGDVLSPGDSAGAAFRNLWYSRHLRAMGEPRLAGGAAPPADEVFRLTVLPSFSPAFAVRLHRRGSSAAVLTTMLRGAGGYEPGRVARHDSVEVTLADAAAYAQRADAAGFWSMPVEGGDLGFDGSRWILEGVRDGRYHVVDRWTPESTGRHPVFLDLANELLRLGGLNPVPGP